MRKRIQRTLVAASLMTALLMCVLVTAALYSFTARQVRGELKQTAATLGSMLAGQEDPAALLSSGVYADRVTLVDAAGNVLYESSRSASGMDNHLSRTEIDEAMNAGEGFSVRNSSTLGEARLYYALRLENGMVLRLSGTQRTLLAMLLGALGWVVLGAMGCVALSALLAHGITARLVKPINAIDLDHPMESDAYEELTPVLRRMDSQNARIAAQMARLSAQRSEMDAILGSMREGLVLLDGHHTVMTMNAAACELLQVVENPMGKTMLAVTRSDELMRLLKAGGGEGDMTLNGRVLHVSASGVEEGGMCLLIQDVTDRTAAEESRRQFSANVSHELRTPLTTVSGYAELLSEGMVRPEDTREMGGRILRESQRLLSLMEDIIRLSRLDEGVTREMAPCDLHAVALACQEKLANLAAEKQVTVTVAGTPQVVTGDGVLLEEMLMNLMENGIRYNHPGGHVQVTAGRQDNRPWVEVQDDGVGIPKEHQPHVFERFYRVDKSRSKLSGGTGLGLSIVKHGALVHHAEIEMESEPGKGTRIRVVFQER